MIFQKQAGFTLMELVIVIVIMGIIVGMSAQPLMQGLDAYTTSKDIDLLDWKANTALDIMVRKIRQVESTSNITTATATQFTCNDETQNSISYTLSGNNLMENAVVLTSPVTSLTFIYFDKNGNVTTTLASIRYVTITLTMTSGGASQTYQTSVGLKNFI